MLIFVLIQVGMPALFDCIQLQRAPFRSMTFADKLLHFDSGRPISREVFCWNCATVDSEEFILFKQIMSRSCMTLDPSK